MMTEIEIAIIRLALDTEITHKDYTKHDLAARKVLNDNEVANKKQLPPSVITDKEYKDLMKLIFPKR